MSGLPKYDGPLAPIPDWLDPQDERRVMHDERLVGYDFALACVDGLVATDVDIPGAIEIAATFVTETGWGHAAVLGNNLGGVKATRAWADAQRAQGLRPHFYRTHGNAGTDDARTVFYRAYDSPVDFYKYWLGAFVPRPAEDTVDSMSGYHVAGRRFWSKPRGDWFAAMLATGYRGEVTKHNPDAARHEQAVLVTQIRIAWCQRALRVAIDGKWGPVSSSAAIDYQKEHRLPTNGVPSDDLIESLSID